jgi:hypothetical protein
MGLWVVADCRLQVFNERLKKIAAPYQAPATALNASALCLRSSELTHCSFAVFVSAAQ